MDNISNISNISYESKYIKYKIKYLNQILQKGGYLLNIDDINIGDILKYEINSDTIDRLKLTSLKNNSNIVVNGKVISKSEDKGSIDNNKIYYDKKSCLVLVDINDNTKITNYFYSDFSNDSKSLKLPFVKLNNKEIILDDNKQKIREQIIKLEEKQIELEKKLNNHYHILSTSGIKEFEELHPYYNKKIN